ncbi:MAG: hypothetical protein D6683_07145, partial [Actinomyces sp.]
MTAAAPAAPSAGRSTGGTGGWPQGLLGRLVDDRADLRLTGLMRAAFGAIVIRHFWPTLTAGRLPPERFMAPWWDWLPVPGVDVYRLVLWAGVAAGGFMVIGLASRVASVVALASVLYLLVLDATAFSHNRAFLVWILFGLSLLPTGRAFALDAVLARRRGRAPSTVGYTWPVLLLRVVTSSVYLTSATTKLMNPDWVTGRVLWDRTLVAEDLIPAAFDGWVHQVLVSRWFFAVLAPAALATELFIGLGLWFRRTRWWAVGVAVVFHLAIE